MALFSAQRTYYHTGSLSAAFHAGGQTAAIAGVFYGIGQGFEGTTYANGPLHVAAHAVAGGVISDLQGGNFGHGFFAAGLTKGFQASGAVSDNMVVGTIQSAVVGGTASVISGGKFSNGAVTAAFQYLYNYARSRPTKLKQVKNGIVGDRGDPLRVGDEVPVYTVTKAIHRTWWADAMACETNMCTDTHVIEKMTIYAQKSSNDIQMVDMTETVVSSPVDWIGPGYSSSMTATHTHYMYSGELFNYSYRIEQTVHVENETFSLSGN